MSQTAADHIDQQLIEPRRQIIEVDGLPGHMFACRVVREGQSHQMLFNASGHHGVPQVTPLVTQS